MVTKFHQVPLKRKRPQAHRDKKKILPRKRKHKKLED